MMRFNAKKLMKGAGALALLGGTTLTPLVAEAAGPKDTLRIAKYANAPALGDVFTNSGSPSQYWYGPLFDFITLVDESGELKPWLAESWQLVDPTTWRFKIRPGMEFSNGEKLDAAAVHASLDWAINTEEGKGKGVGRQLIRAGIVSVSLVGSDTIEIKTKQPNPLTGKELYNLRVVAPKAWKDMGTKEYAKAPVTSGPFKVESWSDTAAEYVRFDKSWRKSPLQRISFRVLPEEITRLQALVSEQVDLAIGMSPDNVAAIERAGQKALVNRAPLDLSWVLLSEDAAYNYAKQTNGGKEPAIKERVSPFKDKRVRQAANMAIDQNAIVKDLLLGMGEPTNQKANKFTFGYNASVPKYEYNLEKAKQLLAEAGYPNGFDMSSEVYVGGIAKDKEIYEYAGAQLSKIGIRTTVKALAFNDYFRKNQTGDIESWAFGLSMRYEPLMDPDFVLKARSCLAAGPKFMCVPEMVPLIEAQSREMDVEKRRKMLQELQAITHDQATSLFLAGVPEIYGYNKRVSGLAVWNQRIQYDQIKLTD